MELERFPDSRRIGHTLRACFDIPLSRSRTDYVADVAITRTLVTIMVIRVLETYVDGPTKPRSTQGDSAQQAKYADTDVSLGIARGYSQARIDSPGAEGY